MVQCSRDLYGGRPCLNSLGPRPPALIKLTSSLSGAPVCRKQLRLLHHTSSHCSFIAEITRQYHHHPSPPHNPDSQSQPCQPLDQFAACARQSAVFRLVLQLPDTCPDKLPVHHTSLLATSPTLLVSTKVSCPIPTSPNSRRESLSTRSTIPHPSRSKSTTREQTNILRNLSPEPKSWQRRRKALMSNTL
jgi:hypothetical protein